MAAVSGLSIKNGQSVDLGQLPVYSYAQIQKWLTGFLEEDQCHCLNYYGIQKKGFIQFVVVVADDATNLIEMVSFKIKDGEDLFLDTLSTKFTALQGFEREIHENFGIDFSGHPWLKPIRFPHDSAASLTTKDYPFFRIESEEIHEVGVGPIHAGIIEPGHFRFVCNGETVLHLEIQLGWQHRGVESLMVSKPNFLEKNVLAESITGDTPIGHALAYVQAMESLSSTEIPEKLEIERGIALELERIAVHTGDLSAMCTDVAYQLGSSVYGALRTPIINFLQKWCGNRFGKGLIRIGGSHFPFSNDMSTALRAMLVDFTKRFQSMRDRTFHLTSVLDRFEEIGQLSKTQCNSIGAVGMVARMAGIKRDIRKSHPFGIYKKQEYTPILFHTGDVMARARVRVAEIEESIQYIYELLDRYQSEGDEVNTSPMLEEDIHLKPNNMAISLTEGWRGEICHQVTTDSEGKIDHYKVKDPSFHNWMALALALRDLEISDFPINNKSFDLSYCGHDL